MSLLVLVRHGQASFGAADYDQLSSLGEQQGALLGAYWTARRARFTAVFCGPLRRHGQTLTAVSRTYPHLPPSQTLPQLAEHQAMEIFMAQLPQLAQRDDALGVHVRRFMAGEEPRRNRLHAFVKFTALWATGALPSGSHEPWAAFRQRVADGLAQMMASAGRDETLVAFTSGGVVAAATGQALGVDDARTMGLNAAVYNSALTTFRFSDGRFSLSQFNGVPHLPQPDLLTYI